MRKQAVLVGAAMLGAASGSFAAGLQDGITFNGFLTAGATYASQPVLDGTNVVSQDGNVENTVGFTNDSRLGIQISANVNPHISVTGQLLARAKDENSQFKADWAFFSYRASDELSIRGGKVKLPTFLTSDYIEVGYAYPWIRPPQEVYFANPISTINGVDVLGRFQVGDSTLLVQPYFGVSRGEEAVVPQEFVTAPAPFGLGLAPGTIVRADFSADNLTGVNLSLGSEVFTVRAGYLKTKVNAPAFGVFEDEATFASAGATLDWKNVVLYSEYFEREIEGRANGAFPNQKGYYATVGYRFGSWLPHLTFAKLDDNDNPTTMGSGIPLMQTSVTAGLRVELGAGAALKIEAQQVKPEEGTRGLLVSDPNGPLSPDPNDSIMIYSVAVDVVF